MKQLKVDHGATKTLELADVAIGGKWGDTGKHPIWIKLNERCDSANLLSEEVQEFDPGRRVFRMGLLQDD